MAMTISAPSSRAPSTGTGAVRKPSASVVHGDPSVDIRGSYGERSFQFFEGLHMRESRKVFFHALVGGQAEPGRRPAAKIREGGGAGNALHVVKRYAGAIAGADQRADAGTCDTINGNAGFRQRAKHADVRDATRESASQREPDAKALTVRPLLAGGERMKFILRVPQPVEGV